MNFLKCVMLCCLFAVGCSEASKPVENDSGLPVVPAESTPEVFSLAISEYPSWSVFAVASENGLINGEVGKQGTVEKKWGVDIKLIVADYDTCLTLFGSRTADAACLTSLDSLAPSVGCPATVILPTSTSVGADACIVSTSTDPRKLADLTVVQETTTYGLEKSVSQYVFERCLQLKGKNVADFKFSNMDPAAAAQAVQTNQANINSIMVWNPFVLQTLRTRTNSQVAFSSESIPEEIIDCVVASKASLKKNKGTEFACAVAETFYEMNKLLDNPETADATLVAVGAKFSNLGLEDMKIVKKQTQFYNTPDSALALIRSEKLKNETNPLLIEFCKKHEILSQDVKIGFTNSDDDNLSFTDEYILKVK